MATLTVKRADRLIAMSVLGTLLLVWLVLAGFDSLLQFVRQLGNIGKNGFSLYDAIAYIMLTLPRRLYQMFSNAALIGGLLGLGGLAATGELTALRAAGMSKLRIAGSAAGVIAVLTLAVVVMGETAAPYGDQHAQAIQVRMRSSNLGSTSSGLWARDGGRIINAKSAIAVQDGDRTTVKLVDVRVYSFTPDGQLSVFSHGDSATHDGNKWIMSKVRTTTLDDQGTHSTNQDTQTWASRLNPHVLEQSVIHPEYLSMADLRRNIRYLDNNGQNSGVYAVAFWGRALFALNTLVLVLCAMPFAFGSLRSGGLGKRLFIGIILAIGWYFLQGAMVNFGTVYGMPPLLANLLPTTLLVAGALAYFRRFG
ncbi:MULTISPECIES: LPS export ABC transporter permease LptG [Rhodanobacteraceae]|uniref:LPS export ABC transporter permease LptG n=1 Tax=Rhodanobacteraceae TaxID=1775411 RepID=UPI00055F1261|nr:MULTISPECIES: LPS export ABC transporter permease LptG [Rhodanobacteraceae]MDR6643140.1 lipopolysaccharide export system permease protein [Luteibacter sp. 1214]SDF89840.1 lipopolysaccharide export system permease protein [Dyella sp. 333MFSha]SKC02390.1 lipopolysaccharide export system permease protein [Luteibacter sp. 22Crub2.1]